MNFPWRSVSRQFASAKGLLVLAMIVDVSERKDAERYQAQMEGRYRAAGGQLGRCEVVQSSGEIVRKMFRQKKQFGYHTR